MGPILSSTVVQLISARIVSRSPPLPMTEFIRTPRSPPKVPNFAGASGSILDMHDALFATRAGLPANDLPIAEQLGLTENGTAGKALKSVHTRNKVRMRFHGGNPPRREWHPDFSSMRGGMTAVTILPPVGQNPDALAADRSHSSSAAASVDCDQKPSTN